MNATKTVLKRIVTIVSTVALAACSSGGGNVGAAGGTPDDSVTTYKHHAFYITCSDQAVCSSYRLYQLTEGETVPKKIGDIDSINARSYGNNDNATGNIVVLNNKVYFMGSMGSTNGLFVFDPKQPETSGTNPKMIALPSGGDTMVSIGNILYFAAQGSSGYELYQFDTSQAESSTNPKVVYDLAPGAADSNPGWLKAIDGKLYFAADGPNGNEPYIYDPAVAASSTNPAEISDLMPSGPSNSSYPREFVGLGGKVYFRAYRAAEGDELWVYNPALAVSSSNPQLLMWTRELTAALRVLLSQMRAASTFVLG